jgi:glycosyltransferase involved in cell wall biosynthesis
MDSSSRHRRVLVVGLNYAPENTGIACYTTGMARMLAEAGHAVHVITGFPHYPQWRVADGYRGRRIEETDGPAGNPIRVTRVAHPVPTGGARFARIAMEAVFAAHAATVRTETPDAVIVVSPALLSVAAARWRWKRPGRTALGVVTQDLYGPAMTETATFGGPAAAAAGRVERALLCGADGVAAIHETFRSTLTRLGVAPERISVVRNWSHVTPIHVTPADVRGVRDHLAWPAGHTIALHAGNMGAKQGLENVVDAARLADRRDLPVTFVIMGDGNQDAALRERARGVQRLRFVSPLPAGEFERTLAAADVLLLNERAGVREMCVPSKLTSYFSAARPVLAATEDTSPAAAEIRAADAGIVLPPARPELLVEAAVALGQDRVGCTRLGRNGRDYALRVYAQDRARADYLAWLDRLTGTPASTPAPTSTPTRTPGPRPASTIPAPRRLVVPLPTRAPAPERQP